MKKNKKPQQLMASRKWKATLIGLFVLCTAFGGILYLLDNAKADYNNELNGLFIPFGGFVVSIISAYLTMKMFSEKNGDDSQG